MCGRFTLTLTNQEFAQAYGMDSEFKPRYNIAPSQMCQVIMALHHVKKMQLMKWGLTSPYQTRDLIINARAETVQTKPLFKNLIQTNRCLVPADGFFEWKKLEKNKIPYYITLNHHQPFNFAGIYKRQIDKTGLETYHFALLTTDANTVVRPLHGRMPVILKKEDEDLWLNEKPLNQNWLQSLLQPFSAEAMQAYPVNPLVNSTKNDQINCIQPIE